MIWAKVCAPPPPRRAGTLNFEGGTFLFSAAERHVHGESGGRGRFRHWRSQDFSREAKRGSEATELREGVEGEFFFSLENSGMKTAFSCTLKPFVPLSYASDSGAARIFRGQSAGAKRPSGGGKPPSHGREIFENSGMKTAFSCTLNAIIRG